MATTQRPTILFIDDDADILTLMGYVFCDEPMELITRHTPEEGMRVLSERPVDCVFLDIDFARAPEGFGFLTALGRIAGRPRIPCLVTSVLDAREVEHQVLALGARKFIPKPYFPGEVLHAIRDAIASAPTTPEFPHPGPTPEDETWHASPGG